MPTWIRNALERLLKAMRLAHVAEVERERQHTERLRAQVHQLRAQMDQQHARRDQMHAWLVQTRDQLDQRRVRLDQLERASDRHAREARRLRAVAAMPRRAIATVLPARVRAAQPVDTPSHADARLASASPFYAALKTRWQRGEAPGGVRHVSIAGLAWAVPADATEPGTLSHRILHHGWLPLEDIAAVRPFVVGGAMLDIGANIGTTCIPRIVLGDFACAYAAEPDLANYECLVGNVVTNGLVERVVPDRIAVSSRTGTARLGRRTHIGSHHLVAADGPEDGTAEEVPCFTVDAWLERLGVPPDAVTFVKSDTQGWDVHVLQGAAGLLSRRRAVWQIEVSPAMLQRAGSTLADLAALVRTHFTHVREVGGRDRGDLRAAADVGPLLDAIASRSRFSNLLLLHGE